METPKTADLWRLIADPNLRCQVANAIVAALPPITVVGTCTSDIATNIPDVMLSTAAELAPRSRRPRGAQGYCAGPGVETKMYAVWKQREEAKRHLRAEPHSSGLRTAVRMPGKNLRKAAVLSFFWDIVCRPETRAREGDQAGFYTHRKTVDLEEKRDRSSKYVKNGDDVLLGDIKLIR